MTRCSIIVVRAPGIRQRDAQERLWHHARRRSAVRPGRMRMAAGEDRGRRAGRGLRPLLTRRGVPAAASRR
ncbi:hypothetical protein BE17_17475 [Sorangium cellulosum]|uniref:Uncharacterized protein n=1 Tax=Sorangium cellulosum TaxID=56 RepID=A0A150RDU0_SORCE|nr:hypothetical protein BE17_17475 [Sorangium cellulosum]